MKKILILLAALLYIFAAEAQTKISQDSIESIHGQKVGRLRPVVSNGFYQKSSEGGDSYNQVLDTETGVPIDSVKTGQEALDSLSANIGRTVFGGNDYTKTANCFGIEVVSITPYFDFVPTSTVTLGTSSGLRMVGLPITTDKTIDSVGFVVATAGTGFSNFNGLALFTKSGTTFTQVAITADSSTPFATTGFKTVSFTSSYSAKAGTVIYVGALTTATGAVVLTAVDKPNDYLKLGDIHYYVTGQSSMPATLNNPSTSSSDFPLFILY